MPTLVIHGLADKMVHVSGGRATASAIPGAELVLIDGMGHDLPTDLYDTFVEGIRRTADRAAAHALTSRLIERSRLAPLPTLMRVAKEGHWALDL